MGRNAILERITVGPLGDGKLALRRASHPLFIDGADHHTSAVGLGEFKHFKEALITIFVVGGVKNTFTTGHFETGLHFLPLGGIEHQRQIHIGDQTAHQ